MIFIFPFLKQINFSNLLNHPIEKTDLDWYANAVNCVKQYLPGVGTYGFGFSGPPEDSTLMTEYQLQNLFVPIILDVNRPQDYKFTIWYLSDPVDSGSLEFNNKDVIAKCGDRFLLIKN